MSLSKIKIWSVYVMAAPDRSGWTYFKVGRTSDVAKRLCGVQTGCPLKIQKAWVLTLWGNGASQSLEAMLHELLRPYHSHGEWFLMRTDDEEHKRAMNEAFAHGVRFASQMETVRWREVSVDELRRAVSEHRAELAGARKLANDRALAKATRLMVTAGRRIL